MSNALSPHTTQLLQQSNLTPQEAQTALIGLFFNQDLMLIPLPLPFVDSLFHAMHAAGVTTQTLAEVLGWPNGPLPVEAIKAFIEDNYFVDLSFMDADPLGVVSVTSPSVVEGGDLVFEVTLSEAPWFEPYTCDAGITGGLFEWEDLDFSRVAFSDGVTYDGTGFVVPVGVGAFTITIGTVDDDEIEVNETVWLEVNGHMPTGTIIDNDAPPPDDGIAFIPPELQGMLPIVQLNDEDGVLSTASLRADVMAHGTESAYWSLFEAEGYSGAGDGVFTNAEVGWSIGDQPATAGTIESVFYGTLVTALQNVDFSEWYNLQTFVFNNKAALESGDEAVFAQLIERLGNTFNDPAGDQAQFDDNAIHGMVVDVGVELLAVAQYSPSNFHGLVNLAGA
jgi:hypothetical protein